MSPCKLSIIIVSHNVVEELRECLDALSGQVEHAEADVFVVDNASSDGTVEIIRREFPWITMLPQSSNLGFSRANNTGIAASSGQYLLFLNPDTVPGDDFLQPLVACLDDHAEAAAVGPRAFWDRSRRFLISCLKVPSPHIALLSHSALARYAPVQTLFASYWKTDWKYWTAGPEPFNVPAIGGAYMMTRKKALDSVGGGFDPGYFLGYEDVDLSLKFRRKGFSLMAVPESHIVHLYGASKRKSPDSLDYCQAWNMEPRRYLSANYGAFTAGVASGLLNLELRMKRTIVRWKGGRKAGSKSAEDEPTVAPLILSWENVKADKYLVEIATSPCFLDKFGAFTANPFLELTSADISNLAPGLYFYRVFAAPFIRMKPVFSETFQVT
jgi:GT2 family glycosyltransferase